MLFLTFLAGTILFAAPGSSLQTASDVHFTPPVYNSTVIASFASKTLLNPFTPTADDPYSDPEFNTSWPEFVCAVRYADASKSTYYLETYVDSDAASSAGAHVTHLNPCGFCSSTKDLSVYMNRSDLTDPVRNCALTTFISMELAKKCLTDIGFTDTCALIWMQNAMNTRKECLEVCLKAWWEGTPSNVPPNSTNLSPCIQCDEDKSGPVFKVVSGRTRRNSGLRSSINRPPESIYPLLHYYY